MQLEGIAHIVYTLNYCIQIYMVIVHVGKYCKVYCRVNEWIRIKPNMAACKDSNTYRI